MPSAAKYQQASVGISKEKVTEAFFCMIKNRLHPPIVGAMCSLTSWEVRLYRCVIPLHNDCGCGALVRDCTAYHSEAGYVAMPGGYQGIVIVAITTSNMTCT